MKEKQINIIFKRSAGGLVQNRSRTKKSKIKKLSKEKSSGEGKYYNMLTEKIV